MLCADNRAAARSVIDDDTLIPQARELGRDDSPKYIGYPSG